MGIKLKAVVWASLALATASTWAKVEGTIGPIPVDKNNNIAIALPELKESEILISRSQYLISYNKKRRAPNWAAWRLEASNIGKTGRSNKFQLDEELEQYLKQHDRGLHAVDPNEYKNSCFDRGHQVPSGDRTNTQINNEATFEMSNMIPQTPYLNRVIWEHFESYTRELVQEQNKKVYVIAGPIYDQEIGNIGPNNDIPVPSKEFKIVFLLDADQRSEDIDAHTPYIAVIMPNVLKDGKTPTPNVPGCDTDKAASSANHEDWKDYKTTLRDIENQAGIHFDL